MRTELPVAANSGPHADLIAIGDVPRLPDNTGQILHGGIFEDREHRIPIPVRPDAQIHHGAHQPEECLGIVLPHGGKMASHRPLTRILGFAWNVIVVLGRAAERNAGLGEPAAGAREVAINGKTVVAALFHPIEDKLRQPLLILIHAQAIRLHACALHAPLGLVRTKRRLRRAPGMHVVHRAPDDGLQPLLGGISEKLAVPRADFGLLMVNQGTHGLVLAGPGHVVVEILDPTFGRKVCDPLVPFQFPAAFEPPLVHPLVRHPTAARWG